MDGSEKIPIFLVFSKLVLDNVKLKILLISWHFLEFFFVVLPPTHSLTPLFFGIFFFYIKVFRWCISGTSFIYVWFAVQKFEISNIFIPAESTILGCFWSVFLDVTHRNVVKFILRGFWFTTFYALRVTSQSLAKLNTLWRYIIVRRFISVALVVVKL